MPKFEKMQDTPARKSKFAATAATRVCPEFSPPVTASRLQSPSVAFI
jgi:hypothetical protein